MSVLLQLDEKDRFIGVVEQVAWIRALNRLDVLPQIPEHWLPVELGARKRHEERRRPRLLLLQLGHYHRINLALHASVIPEVRESASVNSNARQDKSRATLEWRRTRESRADCPPSSRSREPASRHR